MCVILSCSLPIIVVCSPIATQIHIAQLLSTATSLRTLRLNLDFHDDHQAYCSAPWERERWSPLFKTRGFEIVDLMQASCPRLEHIALLYHGIPAATWAEFHPARCAEPRFVLDYTKQHVCVPLSLNRVRRSPSEASSQGFRAVSQGVGVVGRECHTYALNTVTVSLSLTLTLYPSFCVVDTLYSLSARNALSRFSTLGVLDRSFGLSWWSARVVNYATVRPYFRKNEHKNDRPWLVRSRYAISASLEIEY